MVVHLRLCLLHQALKELAEAEQGGSRSAGGIIGCRMKLAKVPAVQRPEKEVAPGVVLYLLCVAGELLSLLLPGLLKNALALSPLSGNLGAPSLQTL